MVVQNDTQQYVPSHRTISLPGFIDINSNQKNLKDNNQSRNYNNKVNNLKLRK